MCACVECGQRMTQRIEGWIGGVVEACIYSVHLIISSLMRSLLQKLELFSQ